MRMTTLIAATLACLAGGAQAATYDFKYEIDYGDLSEAILSSFDTTTTFAGPGLTLTAEGNDYVYFDKGNAGVGVCSGPTSGAIVGKIYDNNSGTNRCFDRSDDSIQGAETLRFTAQANGTLIERIYVNGNHDGYLEGDEMFLINGTLTALSGAGSISGSGDYYIDLGFTLNAGEFFTLGRTGATEDSYVSAISVSAVPLPAGVWLLMGALGGLAAVRRRKS